MLTADAHDARLGGWCSSALAADAHDAHLDGCCDSARLQRKLSILTHPAGSHDCGLV